MWYFVLGLVAGGIIGMILSALMIACRDYDDEEQERWLHEKQKDMSDV